MLFTKWRKRTLFMLPGIFLIIPCCIYIWPIYNRWQVEALLQAKIPDDAINVKYHFVSWQGSSAYLRFDYPPSRLDSFLDETCFKDITLRPNYQIGDRSPDWWKVEDARISKGGTCMKNGVFNDILIDMTDGNLYRIYIISAVS